MNTWPFPTEPLPPYREPKQQKPAYPADTEDAPWIAKAEGRS